MGCYPLKEMISRALGKCNGKERRRHSHRMVYSPPPAYSYQRSSVAKSVNFSNNNPIYVIPSEPEPNPTIANHHHEPGPSSLIGPQVPEPKEPKRTQFAPEPNMHDNGQSGPTQHEQVPVRNGSGQKEAGRANHGAVHLGPDPSHHGPVRKEPDKLHHGPFHLGPDPGYQAYHGPIHHESDSAKRGPIPYYAPSPLPRWEEGPGRREYFSGEYCYYPTPIREGIYKIATDPHRLTNIFSEENPNACAIV